ncbi:MAG TPA: hypothetical protein PKL31_18270 [Fulvivirga sp.]|nr:hypothetical protein [Fulvivirga sp.]
MKQNTTVMYFKSQKLNFMSCLLGLMLLVNHASAQGVSIFSEDSHDSKLITGKHRSAKITWGGLNNFNIEYRGDIEVNDTDTDVIGISPGGYLEISKTTFGSKRSIVIESSAGKLKKEYYEGRSLVNFEPDGRKWLAEILPDIVRSTGIAAKSRVDRFYRKGGVSAVLDEISRLESSYVQSIYGKMLLKKEGLSDNELIRIVGDLSDEMDSDYYLADLLIDASDQFLKKEATSAAYFEAVSNIGSDYYTAQVLTKALKKYEPSEVVIGKIMNASRNIGSDYYQTVVLDEVLDLRDLNSSALNEIIEAATNIGSDYYQTQVLSKAMKKEGLTTESFSKLMEAVSHVSSDYYMSSVFSNMLDNKLDEAVQVKMIVLLDENMNSDYYLSTVLSKMASEQRMGDKSMEQFAKAIGNMSSANYATSVIKSAAKADKIDKRSLIALINACSEISSDYYLSSALESLSWHVNRSDEEVKSAYRAAAKHISSDTYYGRAVKAID